MQQEIELAVLPEKIGDEDFILREGAAKLKINALRIKGFGSSKDQSTAAASKCYTGSKYCFL